MADARAREVLPPGLAECEAERGLTRNLVAVNCSRSGDLPVVIDEINGVGATPE